MFVYRRDPLFTPLEEETIRQFNANLAEQITIQLHMPDDPIGKELAAFCEQLTRIAPKIKAVLADGDTAGNYPAILIGPGLQYRAIPSGKQLEPFLDTLSFLDSKKPEISATINTGLNDVDLPAAIRIYIMSSCPHCPAVLQQILPLPFAKESIHLTVVDGMLFPVLAEKDRVRSVPTVIIDDQFRWTGTISIREIIEALTHRNPSMLGRSALQRILLEDEGGVFNLVAMIERQEKIFPAFYALLLEETFTTRLAAMVVMESLIEANLALAQTAIEPIQDGFSDAADQVKGDILYILGELKSKNIRPFLNEIINGDYTGEVKEAALEALEKIKKKG